MKKMTIPALLLLICLHSHAQVTGAGRDKHGCISTAGYTWSELKQKCIRSFEQEEQLQAPAPGNSDSATHQYGLVFSRDRRKAEVFIPNGAKNNIVLSLSGRNAWRKGSYILLLKMGKYYQLTHAGKLLAETKKQ